MPKKKNIKTTSSPLVNGFLTIGFALFIIWVGYNMVMTVLRDSPYFKIKTITISASLQPLFIPELDRLKGQSLFFVNLTKEEEKLKIKYPQLAQLRLVRQFPDQIAVKARERIAIAQVQLSRKIVTIDERAIVLEVSDRIDPLYVFVSGLKTHSKIVVGYSLNAPLINNVLTIIKTFKKINTLSKIKLTEIIVESESKIVLKLSTGGEAIIDKDGIEEKLKTLGLVLNQPQLNIMESKYVDLRFKEPVVGQKNVK